MVLTFEELISNTIEMIGSICRWLNLEVLNYALTVQPDNVTPELVAQPILSGRLHRLRHENRFLHVAVEYAPNSVRTIGSRMLRRTKSRLDVDASDVMQYLRPLQRRQTQELTRLIGREFPEWTTLNNA
jgi:hypothetical protein